MGNFGKGLIRKVFVILWLNCNYEKNEPEMRIFKVKSEIMKDLGI